jgi:hydroxymethylpyrimidine/phosphomethylpyrimidine kinase
MVSTSGASLAKNNVASALIKKLFPVAAIITPNIPEAESFSGKQISNEKDMEYVAKLLGDNFGCAVLLKGGHSVNDANDLLYRDGKYKWLLGKRINNPNTHGTGCTLSSAIASNLAKGYDLETSVSKAKDYVSNALSAMLNLGKGSGPMNHAFVLDN